MKYEKEYMPDVTEMEDAVHIFHDGKAGTVHNPDVYSGSWENA